MGCAGLGLAFLLAFAVPASIARHTLVGAVVVITVLAAGAVVAVLVRVRRRPAGATDDARSTRSWLTGIVVIAVAYLVLVTAIHAS